MRLAALQLHVRWEDRAANQARVREWTAPLAGGGTDLLVLPEMFTTGFSMNPSFTAEEDDGPTTAFLQALAADLGCQVLGGLVLKGRDGRGLNVARLVDPTGRVVATRAKSHLFRFGGEHLHHAPGEGPEPFPLGPGLAAAFICYDLRFPEVFRKVAADCWLHVVMAAWPASRQRAWDVLLPARAVENQVWVLGVNQVGDIHGQRYGGGTALYSPAGQAVWGPTWDTEALMEARADPHQVSDLRARFPFLADRRF